MSGADHAPMTVSDRDILIVDDEPDVAREIADGLIDEGYRCLVVDSALSALDLVTANPQRFGLVVTDIRMPGMDGVTLARRILEACGPGPRPGIVMVTGHAVPQEVATALPPCSVEVVRKPFRWEEFLAHVQRAHRGAATPAAGAG